MKFDKYQMPKMIDLPGRTWPNKKLTKAPIWCSVDLRDGNQALEVPMDLNQKVQFFDYLVKLGFKTIEIGYPAASDTEYEFTRHLIDNDIIPRDVTVQVLTMAREDVIHKTFEAVSGARSAIVHLYNATSRLQREVVFGFDKQQCKELAVKGAKLIQAEIDADESNTDWHLEYSPENFSETEPEFAVEIVDAVLDIWKPTPENKVIINLPETVEMTMPNVFADMIEYFCTHTKYRDSIIVSIHTHNDRGTGVAASELALLAGAERVEGTLFGNGERTGNCDIITLAMNMFMNGSPEQYAEMHTNIVDGKTVAYQYGQYTDYADGGSEVFHCNLCVDLGNDTHLGVRLYNFVPLVDYESGQTFVIDDGIIPVIVDGIVGF